MLNPSLLDSLSARFGGAFIVPLTKLDGVLCSTPGALYQAHRRGDIKFRTRIMNGRVMVSLLDLAAWIEDPDRANLAPSVRSETLKGRPTVAERAECDRLGISVGEFRRIRAGHTVAGGAQ